MAQLPDFVNRDYQDIISEIKARAEELYGKEILPAQYEMLNLNIIGYAETRIIERINAAVASQLVNFSLGSILDYVVALLGVERLPAAFAGCYVKFTLVDGHGSVVLPGGSRVATSNGIIFWTGEDLTIDKDTNELTVLVTAQIAGKAANGIAVGDVKVILDPYAWISSVENITVSGGGSDTETDEQLRERYILALWQFSTAGSRLTYMFYGKSANAAILDISVNRPYPGLVVIVPLLSEGVYEQVLKEIYDACSADTVRPLNDTVIVAEPRVVNYTIDVELTLFVGADVNNVKQEVNTALSEFAEAKSQRLGMDIVRSQISQISRVDGVYDVKIIEPPPHSNLVIDFDEVPICDEIKINVTGFSHG